MRAADAMRTLPRKAFTLIEVLAIVAVAGVGLAAVIGLVFSGLRAAGRAQVEAVGMATAVSVANDPAPLLAPESAGDWTYTPYDMDSPGPVSSQATGWVNGLYVVRDERSVAADVIAREGATVFARAADVVVEVFDARAGRPVASFATRLVRQRGTRGP